MARDTHIATVSDLSRSFGPRLVLDRVNFAVAVGQRFAVRGPNGSGKTTLLRCLLGTLTPSSGFANIAGYAPGSVTARRLIGASLAHERSFYLRLTGNENLIAFARLRGLTRREAQGEVARTVDELEIDTFSQERADRCSTGQLQQLGFARALLGQPRLLLLDEVTRSLDLDARARIWGAIERRPDTTVIFTSHLEDDLNLATGVLELPKPR